MDVRLPDGTIVQNVPEGITQSQLMARLGKMPQAQPQDTAQPSTLDRLIASPVGRFAQENVVAPALGLGTMLSHAVTNDPRVDTMQNAETGGYDAALARNRNTPGYAEARALVDQSNLPSGAASGAFLPSVQSSIAGLPGLMTGNLDMSNAMADAASQHQEQYRKDNPGLAAVQGLTGGFAAVPQGGAKLLSAAEAPTVEELKKSAKTAYDQVKSAGLEISVDPVRNMVKDVSTKLAEDGFDPVLHPNTARSLARLNELATGDTSVVPLTQLETERKVAGQASKAAMTNPSDSHMAGIIQDHIDSLVEDLHPSQIASGDPAAAQTLQTARETWKTAKKAQMISDAFERAQNASQLTQSGYENALRGQFRQIANSPKKMNAFSKAEQNAIKLVVRGGKLDNVLRWAGKLAPRGVVSAMGDIALGHATGAGVAPFMLAGEGAKALATKATLSNASRAANLVRNGGDAAALGPQLAPAAAGPRPLPLGLIGSGYEQQQYQPWGLSPQY